MKLQFDGAFVGPVRRHLKSIATTASPTAAQVQIRKQSLALFSRTGALESESLRTAASGRFWVRALYRRGPPSRLSDGELFLCDAVIQGVPGIKQ